jgi:hypothetical protein
MSRLKPETAWRQIVEDTRLPCKARVMALEQIARPSVSLLRCLLAAKSTPPNASLVVGSPTRRRGLLFISDFRWLMPRRTERQVS